MEDIILSENQSNILIIGGVYPEEFQCETINYKKIEKETLMIDKFSYQEEELTELPARFTGVNNWPKTSNLRCYSCDLIPNSYPKFIPCNIISIDNCDYIGHFCEWNCAVRFVLHEFSGPNKWDLLKGVYEVESLFSGVLKKAIPESPPKTIMQAYCGKKGITPAEYKAQIRQLNETYNNLDNKSSREQYRFFTKRNSHSNKKITA